MTDYLPVVTELGAALVSRAEFKLHAHIDGDDEDTLVDIYVAAASAYVSKWTGREATESTWAQEFDGFARELRLGVSPLTAIEEVSYLDAEGVAQIVDDADYVLVNGAAGIPTLRFIDDYSFPTVQAQAPVLTVTMVAGYAAADPERALMKASVLLTGSDLFANRESQSEAELKSNPAVRSLLDLIRTRWIA